MWHSPAAGPDATGPSRIATSFAEWSKVGAEANRMAEVDAAIWDCGSTSTASNWPSSYGSAASLQNNFIDSMAVGSGSRNTIQARHQEDSVTSPKNGETGMRARSSDLREVEVSIFHYLRLLFLSFISIQYGSDIQVGLGFNPFKSDIWGQSDGGPSWGSSYRQYSSNNE